MPDLPPLPLPEPVTARWIETDSGLTGWGEGTPWGHTYVPAHGPGIRAAASKRRHENAIGRLDGAKRNRIEQ